MGRPRLKQLLVFASAAIFVAVVAVGLGVVPWRARSHPSASLPTGPASSAVPVTAGELSQLTRRAPCPPAANAGRATRAQLRAFHAVAAVRCVEREQTYPDGEWTVIVREASQSRINALAAGLDKPDAPRTSGPCAAVLIGTPPLVLVDVVGQYLVPTFPRDACGQPEASLADLPVWQIMSTQRLRQQRTAAQIANHCQPAWKNEVYLDGQAGAQASPGGPVFTDPAASVLYVCLYQAPAADLSVGAYVRGLTLSADGARQLRAALSGADAGGSCAPQRQFAVIGTASGPWVNVELGGCWRVQRPDNAIGTAQPQLVRALLGLRRQQ